MMRGSLMLGLCLLAAASSFACSYHPLEDSDVELRSARFGRKVSLEGVVIHRFSEQPIAGVEIELNCPGWTRTRHLTTDANGEFRARGLPPGACGVCVRAGNDDSGHSFNGRPGQHARMTFRLLPTRSFTHEPCRGYTLTRARSGTPPA